MGDRGSRMYGAHRMAAYISQSSLSPMYQERGNGLMVPVTGKKSRTSKPERRGRVIRHRQSQYPLDTRTSTASLSLLATAPLLPSYPNDPSPLSLIKQRGARGLFLRPGSLSLPIPGWGAGVTIRSSQYLSVKGLSPSPIPIPGGAYLGRAYRGEGSRSLTGGL